MVAGAAATCVRVATGRGAGVSSAATTRGAGGRGAGTAAVTIGAAGRGAGVAAGGGNAVVAVLPAVGAIVPSGRTAIVRTRRGSPRAVAGDWAGDTGLADTCVGAAAGTTTGVEAAAGTEAATGAVVTTAGTVAPGPDKITRADALLAA